MNKFNKIWLLIRNTDLLNIDEKNELHLYLGNLKEQLKKKQDVIDKTIEYTQHIIDELEKRDMLHVAEDELLDILKEVE